MSIIYIVLPLALLIVLAAVLAFSWAARRGQFDDLDTPALRMLHDDVVVARPESHSATAPDTPKSTHSP